MTRRTEDVPVFPIPAMLVTEKHAITGEVRSQLRPAIVHSGLSLLELFAAHAPPCPPEFAGELFDWPWHYATRVLARRPKIEAEPQSDLPPDFLNGRKVLE